MNSITLWLINTAINISEVFCIIGLILFFGSIVATVCYITMKCDGYGRDDNGIVTLKKVYKTGFIVSAILLAIAASTPTRKELAVIYVLPKIIENEKVQQIPDKALEKILDWLEVEKKNKDL